MTQQAVKYHPSELRTECGITFHRKTHKVVDGTVPQSQRQFDSRVQKPPRCIREDGRFCNVEWFAPVAHDIGDRPPPYNKDWEIRDKKTKRIVKIEFPRKYVDWYLKHRKRCFEGYEVGGVFIPGDLYWYINFWMIKAKERGKGMINPDFRSLTYDLAIYEEEARKAGEHSMNLKSRQVGNTEYIGSCGSKACLLLPNAEVIYTSGLEDKARNAYMKAINGINTMHPSNNNLSREFYKRVHKQSDNERWFGFKSSDDAIHGYNSHMLFLTLFSNAEALSGYSPTDVFVDEAGLVDKLLAAHGYIDPGMRENEFLGGRMIHYGGTGGEMEKALEQFMKMFYNHEMYGIRGVENIWDGNDKTCAFFISGLRNYVTDNDGNDYMEASNVLWEEEAAKRKNDRQASTQWRIARPRKPGDAFLVNNGNCPFNMDKLQRRLEWLVTNNAEDMLQRGRFDWILDGSDRRIGVKWVPAPDEERYATDSDGDDIYPILIKEHPQRPGDSESFEHLFSAPQYQNLYGAGTDSYDKEVAATSKSKLGFSIRKGYLGAGDTSNFTVMTMLWRPNVRDKAYEQTAMACLYYGADNLIEYTNILIMEWYKANDLEYLLRESPMLAKMVLIDSKVDNKYGIDPGTRQYWIADLADYIERNVDNIWFPELCRRYLLFDPGGVGEKKKNDDLVDADMVALQNLRDKLARDETSRDASDREEYIDEDWLIGI